MLAGNRSGRRALRTLVALACWLALSCASQPASSPTASASPSPSAGAKAAPPSTESGQTKASEPASPALPSPSAPAAASPDRLAWINLVLAGQPETPILVPSWKIAWPDELSLPKAELQLVIRSTNQSIGPGEWKLNLAQSGQNISLPPGLWAESDYEAFLACGSRRSSALGFRLAEPYLEERLAWLAANASSAPIVSPKRLIPVSLPVPPGVNKLRFALRGQAGQSLWQSGELPMPDKAQAWRRFETQLAPSGSWDEARLWYCQIWESGLQSSWQALDQVRTTLPDAMAAVFPRDGATVNVEEPVFRWQVLVGHPLGRIELSANPPGDAAGGSISLSLRNGSSAGRIASLLGLKPGASFWWRLSSIPDLEPGPAPGAWQRVSYQPLGLSWTELVPAGSERVFSMGKDDGLPDQAPQRLVRLTRPCALANQAMSNQQLAMAMNAMLQEQRAIMGAGRVKSPDGRLVYLGLGDLDYGSQFGLRLLADGRLAPLAGRENHPAVGISWHGAQAVCAWLNWQSGTTALDGYRLPSEAEWEYAASGAGTWPSPWGLKPGPASANYLRSGDAWEDPLAPYTRKGGPTVPLGHYLPARLAAYQRNGNADSGAAPLIKDPARLEMLGNVWDWCEDRHAPYQAPDTVDPLGRPLSREAERELLASGQVPSRVVRGGAWNTSLDALSPWYRGKFPDAHCSYSIGLRLAKSSSAQP